MSLLVTVLRGLRSRLVLSAGSLVLIALAVGATPSASACGSAGPASTSASATSASASSALWSAAGKAWSQPEARCAASDGLLLRKSRQAAAAAVESAAFCISCR